MMEANSDSILMERIKTLVKEGKIEESGRACASYLNQTTSENFLSRLENIIEALSAIVGGKNVIKYLIKNLVIDVPSLLENLSKKDSVLRYSFLFLLKAVCEEEIDLFLPYSVDLLNSPDPNVREADLQLLMFMAGGQKKIEDITIIQTIKKKLADEKDFVVQKAIQALKLIGKNSPNIVTNILKEYAKEVPENENVKKAIDSIFKTLVSVDTVKEIEVKKVDEAPIKKEEIPIKKEAEPKKVEEIPIKKEAESKKVEELAIRKDLEPRIIEEPNKLYIEIMDVINQLKLKEIEIKNKEIALKEIAFKLKQNAVSLGLKPDEFAVEFISKKDLSYPQVHADVKARPAEIVEIETALKQTEIDLKKKELEIDEIALKLKKAALEVEMKPVPQVKELKLVEPIVREKPTLAIQTLETKAVDVEKELKNKELELKKKQLEEKEKELKEKELQEKEKALILKEALLEKESKLQELSKVELELKQKTIEEKEKKIMAEEAKRVEHKLDENQKK